MALRQNNAEGMASGADLAAAQTGSGDAFSTVAKTGNPTGVYSSVQSAHGAQSYYINGTTTDQFIVRYEGASETLSAARMYIRFIALPSAATNFLELRDINGGQNAAIGISAGGLLQVKNAEGAALASFANVPNLNTWYHIELQVAVGSSTADGTIKAAYYLSDSTTPAETVYSSSTVNAGTSNIGSMRVGKIVTATTFNAYIDDIAWNSGVVTPIGPVAAISNQVPIANAGSAQMAIEPYATVTLTGTDDDTDGSISIRTWRQISGTSVQLFGTGATRTYIAPGTLADATMVFGYTVTDNGTTSMESIVSHTVLAVTERAVIGGVETPQRTTVISDGATTNAAVWTIKSGNLVKRAPAAGDAFVIGSTKPTITNTGPVAGGYNPSLNVINGDVTMSVEQVIENATINGFVTMASGSILRGCVVRGRGAGLTISQQGNNNALVNVASGLAQPPTIEYCDIGQSVNLGYWMNAMKLNGACFVRRNNIHDGTDFIKASGTQTSGDIAGNWFHDYTYHNDDGDQSGSTPAFVSHNDGIQWNSGANGFNFRGNNMEMYYSSTTSVETPSAANNVGWGCPLTVSGSTLTQNLNIEYNWFSGGGCGVFQANTYPVAQGGVSMGSVAHNRVALDQYDYKGGFTGAYQIRYATAYASLVGETTNYFDASLPGVTEAGIPDGKLFVLGTTATSGIRRP